MANDYVLLSDMLLGWKDSLLTGKPPQRYRVGNGEFEHIPLYPKQVIAIGAPPSLGKTALVMGWTFNALCYHPELKAVVCNVEMPAERLLERELARQSNVPLDWIQSRQFQGSPSLMKAVSGGLDRLAMLADRMIFAKPTLEAACKAVIEIKAGLLVLDYIQRLTPPDKQDMRGGVSDAMGCVRELAAKYDTAVIVVSAVSRGTNRDGRAYSNLSLGSFRETSELEYGADDCYILEDDPDNGEGWKTLRHVKSRYGKRQDIKMMFKGEYQQFIAKGVDNG